MVEKNFNKLAVEALNDEDAFTEIYQHFYPRVHKFILAKVVDEEAADEIISETFFKMYDNLRKYDPNRAAFSTWLYNIALNEMKMFWRKKNYRGEHEENFNEEIEISAPEFEEPEQKFLQGEQADKIRAALEKISERERKIIEMTYWLNYPPRKIAEVLDLKPNTVSVILKRAKENLKKYL